MRKPRAPKSRTKLAEIAASMPKEGMTTLDAVRKLRKNHSAIVAEEAHDLIEMGLMRLASAVFARKAGLKSGLSADLLGEYHVLPLVPVSVETKSGNVEIRRKKLADLTVGQAREFAERRLKPSASSHSEAHEMMRLIAFVEANGAKDTDNLIAAWVRASA